jgi:hypothetical protein
MDKQFTYQQRAISPSTAWLMFLFLGWSYGSMNQMGKQIFYYLTLGGLGAWTIYRLFTLNGAIKKYNRDIAMQCGFNGDEVMMMGLV